VLVGPRSNVLTASKWAREQHNHRGGQLPHLDLELHKTLVEFVTGVVADRLVQGAHDIADGGLALAVAEMAIVGKCGAQVDGIDGHGELFSEASSRVLLVVDNEHLQAFEDRLEESGLPFAHLGVCAGDRLFVSATNGMPLIDVAVEELLALREGAVPAALAAGTAH
jgi:phosphoribosylformylglycinamidine synthase